MKLIPAPYLRAPFDVAIPHPIIAGWNYDAAEIAIHGIKGHGAIDFGLPFGTPILAAANGFALATWDERWLVNDDGKPRLSEGKRMTFGQGLTVQIYHGGGRYTQYGHLVRLSHASEGPVIPFHASIQDQDGNLPPSDLLRALVSEYRRKDVAVKVMAGDVIGYAGVTGGAFGSRTYDLWQRADCGVKLSAYSYITYMEPHLHFIEFRRGLKSRNAERHDPFGRYGVAGGYANGFNQLPIADALVHPPIWRHS